MTHIYGDPAARHARESTARAAALVGGSRESVRRYKVLSETAPELAGRVKSGELSLNAAYRAAVGEQRRPLYLQLAPDLDDLLADAADDLGMTRQDVVRMAVVEFLASEDS